MVSTEFMTKDNVKFHGIRKHSLVSVSATLLISLLGKMNRLHIEE